MLPEGQVTEIVAPMKFCASLKLLVLENLEVCMEMYNVYSLTLIGAWVMPPRHSRSGTGERQLRFSNGNLGDDFRI